MHLPDVLLEIAEHGSVLIAKWLLAHLKYDKVRVAAAALCALSHKHYYVAMVLMDQMYIGSRASTSALALVSKLAAKNAILCAWQKRYLRSVEIKKLVKLLLSDQFGAAPLLNAHIGDLDQTIGAVSTVHRTALEESDMNAVKRLFQTIIKRERVDLLEYYFARQGLRRGFCSFC